MCAEVARSANVLAIYTHTASAAFLRVHPVLSVANLLRRKWLTSLATRWILLITPPNSIGLEVHPAEIRDS
ncbi:hypothetical protein Pmani_030464 [Petrolisthes manimaculis]|uniref:Uncharacterized protein n=1 Tax=Petrolisthes manimaculis TaxID=1843537 RepID=A0AAE1NVY5_9EUCA|nr:hypothetical protein Pmani_030464 [Petrolisthes manimaculis]